MKTWLTRIAFGGFVLLTLHAAQSIPYQYFTESEISPLGERIRFFNGDSLWGAVRSNDTISIMQSPVFYDYVITTAPDFGHGVGYNPQFRSDYYPVFNAPPLTLPYFATQYRDWALEQGHYFNPNPGMQARVVIGDHNLNIMWGELGEPFDSTDVEDHALPDSAIVFFDCPIQVSGTCYNTLILAASENIGIADNVLYPSTDILTGLASEEETAKLALISERSVIILNTHENGRENSAGLGRLQPDQDSTSVVISGMVIALDETFTFDEQNDVGDPYICGPPNCPADERGFIRAYGGIIQRRRGYTHRSNVGGTGYLKNYHFDERLRYWDLPLFEDLPEPTFTPAALDFGEVMVGEESVDSVQILLPERALIDVPHDSIGPIFVEERIYVFDSLVSLPIHFAPESVGEFEDEIAVWVEGQWFPLLVQGIGDSSMAMEAPAAVPGAVSLSVHPNPFNSTAMIQFALPQAGQVTLDVYNIAGQRVSSVTDRPYSAGAHSVMFDAAGLASGVYLMRLDAAQNTAVHKVVLMK